MKLLVADDSLLVRNTIKRLLAAMEIENIELLEAKNGREALEIYIKEEPDAILLDLLMPEINGEGVLAKLNEIEQKCFIAVLSSNIQEPVKKRCLGMGTDIFIEKPITLEKMKYFFIKFEQKIKR
ncbi:MAG: response regulator [Desulfamplus sp.]|nr:response regulator [Desulfamplus sp.]